VLPPTTTKKIKIQQSTTDSSSEGNKQFRAAMILLQTPPKKKMNDANSILAGLSFDAENNTQYRPEQKTSSQRSTNHAETIDVLVGSRTHKTAT
jgi:hypothetical protein